MSRKSKKEISERPRSRINQFIIECLFSKYFEEEEEKEIALSPSASRNDSILQRV